MNWQIHLLGLNSVPNWDNRSEINLSQLSESLQTVQPPNWTTINIEQINPGYAGNEIESRSGVAGIVKKGLYRIFEIIIEPYNFSEFSQYEAIQKLCNHNYLLICLDGEEQDDGNKYPNRIHEAGKALVTACTCDVNHVNSEGIKVLTLNGQSAGYMR